MSWATRVPSSASQKVLAAAIFAAVGSASYFIYQRVVLGNPMRMGFDEEGVWAPVSRERHLAEKIQVRIAAIRTQHMYCFVERQAAPASGSVPP